MPDAGRAERAKIVEETYIIEPITPGVFKVQHPTEDIRSYITDINSRDCECPDFTCRGNIGRFWCKHLIAIGELTGIDPPENPVEGDSDWF